jgi:hypothetical protein
MDRTRKWLAAACLALLAACGGSSGSTTGSVTALPPPPAAPADINLLFFGNSHTAANDLPGLVAALVRAARPGRTVAAVNEPTWLFLDERLKHAPSKELLASRRWSVVVLQAQKYSSSGNFTYSTFEAAEWVRMARANGAVPVLFPEWPRRDLNETDDIFNLHLSIAAQAPACVPPIPQSWDLALAADPALPLWAADGNHSAPAGALLAAMVIASTITGDSPAGMPTLASVPVDAATQAALRTAASKAVTAVPPRRLCPGDPYPS